MLALNLALAAAEAGDSVLLIDGDEKQHLLTSNRLGAPADGLSDVLGGRFTPAEVIVADPSGACSILPASSLETKFAPWNRQHVAALLADLHRGYDTIVVVGGVLNADRMTRLFAEAVDEVAVTLQCGKTQRVEFADAIAGARPLADKLGCVML